MNEQENREERARQAMLARQAVEEAALSICFIPDEAAAKALAATVVEEPAEWMFFGSRVELEDLEFGFDRRLRRLPLGVSIFVFCNFTLDSDPTLWLEPAVFDATLRLHAWGGKLYMVWIDSEKARRRLDAEWAIAQEKAKGLPPKDPDQPPF